MKVLRHDKGAWSRYCVATYERAWDRLLERIAIRGESLFTIFASLAQAISFLMVLQIYQF